MHTAHDANNARTDIGYAPWCSRTLRVQLSLLTGIGMLSLFKAGSATRSLHDVLSGQTASRLGRISGPECSTVSVQIRMRNTN